MRQVPRIYLAGPDVFLPDAKAIGRLKHDLCREHGFIGLYPLDNDMEDMPGAGPLSLRIFEANLGLMREADAIIANLTPFRGPSADAGTVYELGVFSGFGKPSFGYSNVPGSYLDRSRSIRAGYDGKNHVDDHGMMIEDFGLEDNLMLVHALETLGAPLVTPWQMPDGTDAIWRDLNQFEACLRLAARHFHDKGDLAA